ncbi:MAG: VWA domain-containing protein [Proteobacteria bacterium]|nr:VWA domain-containing protein [Pseudomonadota bacterium]
MSGLSFRFAYPEVLLLLVPVLAWLYFLSRSRPRSMRFSTAGILAPMAGPWARVRARLPLALRVAVLALLVVAAARPQTYNVAREVKSPGVDIILCLDTSGSMGGMDFTLDGRQVDRLTAVKKVVTDFIKKRESDRIGLVIFGSQAFTQVPLTLDKGLLLSLVNRMKIGMAGENTAIGDSLALSGKRIKDIPAKSKVVILLTDGRHNEGSVAPKEAAQALAALGIRVHTIGVGTTGPVPFMVRTVFGQRTVYQNVDLDEDTLREVARIGKGRYFRASDTDTLEAIYNEINQMEQTEVKIKEFFHFHELYVWFLFPALALLGLELLAARMRPLP